MVINYNYYEDSSCTGESILNINSTYLLRYRRENEESIYFLYNFFRTHGNQFTYGFNVC